MNRKKILIVILILGIIGAFTAYRIYNKPHVDVANTKPDISLTANKILNDFSSDENEANTKYLEKIIEVKGVISGMKTEKGLGIISLKTNDDFGSLLCHLSEESTTKMSNIKEGQIISIKGICTGYLMDVILVKCEVLTN
jgi:DNA/RNA endonuclease YhcR with UshA esterase domain